MANHKLMQCQLMRSVHEEFGMDSNPVPYFAGLMPRWEATLDDKNQFGAVREETRLQLQSFWAEQFLGQRGTAADQFKLVGIPIAWIRYARNLQTLQATARAVLLAANPPPNTVAHMPKHTEKASEASTEEEGKAEKPDNNNTKLSAADPKPATKPHNQLTQSPT